MPEFDLTTEAGLQATSRRLRAQRAPEPGQRGGLALAVRGQPEAACSGSGRAECARHKDRAAWLIRQED